MFNAAEVVKSYKSVAIGVLASHSSLQIIKGARELSLRSVCITVPNREKMYSAFPYAMPDEFVRVDRWDRIDAARLRELNVVLVPHGSLIEYNKQHMLDLEVPVFGNRKSLLWESKREKMYEWLRKAGLKVPKVFASPDEVDRPCLIKYDGAKGGQGYVVVDSPSEAREALKKGPAVIQEFVTGVRLYPHFFYSPLRKNGYRASEGRVELLGFDRRVESNVDEVGREVALFGKKAHVSFTVVANEMLAVRESLIPQYLEMGKAVIETADELFGGIPGPFCLETIVTSDLDIYVFEISARIVAGTNVLFSPYSRFVFGEEITMGERIAREVKDAYEMGMLEKVVS